MFIVFLLGFGVLMDSGWLYVFFYFNFVWGWGLWDSGGCGVVGWGWFFWKLFLMLLLDDRFFWIVDGFWV